ncbi:TRAP transporter large permease [Deferribacter abyssi]|uniref:TRAP transporter large permease n=1 Tax=Deferribacter abyssi TaxID=213806 RepID=UPI003C176247
MNIAIVSLIILLTLLLLSIPVAATMGVLGIILEKLYSPFPLIRAIGDVAWSENTSFVLFAIPLFILLGQILLKSGIAGDTYKAIDKWLSWLPGGLMHANIMTSALFAATSGSSVATAATIGTLALPQAEKYGYNESLFAGSIAAGGTLGILIPPSINLIVYGFLTNTSIPRLFVAGIIPGIMLAFLFMFMILILCIINPKLGKVKKGISWQERIKTITNLLPILIIFLVVVGSIYAGFATPTESAAMGVIASLIITAIRGNLNLNLLKESIEGTMRSTGMIMLILLAATYLNFILVSLGLTDILQDFIRNLGFSPLNTLLIIIAMYIVLGFFIETLSMMVLTIPIVYPVILNLGFDPIWFGILLILLIEMALITPPVGLNLYVVQGVRGKGSIKEIIIGSVPFVIMMIIMIAVLIMFPEIVLYLPAKFN